MKIDHIGIATERLDEGLAIWQDALGLAVAETEEIAEQRVRIAMLPIGETRIELLEPIHSDSPIEKFMAKRGEGIHHIAVRVDNIEEALQRFKESGARLIDTTPRVGAHNTRIAFVHPSSTHGVLLELVEHVK